jgi:hypothetical protein
MSIVFITNDAVTFAPLTGFPSVDVSFTSNFAGLLGAGSAGSMFNCTLIGDDAALFAAGGAGALGVFAASFEVVGAFAVLQAIAAAKKKAATRAAGIVLLLINALPQ